MTSQTIILNHIEMSELLIQNPDTKKDGGFQSLLVSLQERLNKTTGAITLEDTDLERIAKYAFDYKNGGWEDRLKSIFQRTLGPKLGR
ncbi:MAG TPA: aspartyl-tRNA synthetase [Ruminococcaceae bacterium]|nr:aspartyl-tRNA synthetase [Oscillospiraceae bacterium]